MKSHLAADCTLNGVHMTRPRARCRAEKPEVSSGRVSARPEKARPETL